MLRDRRVVNRFSTVGMGKTLDLTGVGDWGILPVRDSN